MDLFCVAVDALSPAFFAVKAFELALAFGRVGTSFIALGAIFVKNDFFKCALI